MNTLDAGMKCSECIRENLKNVVVASDPTPVQLAVDHAETAVTIYSGRAVCVNHLHQQVIEEAALNSLSGRRTKPL